MSVGWADDSQAVRYLPASELLKWLDAEVSDLEASVDDLPSIAVLSIDGFQGHPCVRIDESLPTLGDPCVAIGPAPYDHIERFTLDDVSPRRASGLVISQKLGPYIVRPLADVVTPTMFGAAVLNLRTNAVCGMLIPNNSGSTASYSIMSIESTQDFLAEFIAASGIFHLLDKRWAVAAGDSTSATSPFPDNFIDPDLITTREDFSAALAELRRRSGRSLSQITALANRDKAQLSRYFSGRRLPPNIEVVYLLIRACGVDHPDLRRKWVSAFRRVVTPLPDSWSKYGIFEADQENLLFRLYIPSERLYAAEADRLLSLFRDWLETTRGRSVRQSGYRTASGEMYEFFIDRSAVAPDLREEFDRFSNFLALYSADPSAAADLLASLGLERAISVDFAARVGREVRRLQRDLTHERERRILDIQHSIEEELVDAGVELRVVPRAEIRAMIESLVPGPSTPDSFALLAASQPAQMTAPVTININPQIIHAVESTIIHKAQGTFNLGPQAKELLTLIDRFGGQEAGTLQSAVYELEDSAAPPTARSKAKDRLKNFLRQLPSTAKEIGVDMLEKYIERRLGLS